MDAYYFTEAIAFSRTAILFSSSIFRSLSLKILIALFQKNRDQPNIIPPAKSPVFKISPDFGCLFVCGARV